MAIKMMMFENGSTGPVAVCDVCGRAIRDAAGATALWLREQEDRKSTRLNSSH